ncbi:MAG: L-threonylcarbamoyladenylate synthase [Eubacteriales bacterium]|nr:L-threonylcarbamoyladenylate synthase [Eubacteriales bacterium]
MQTLILRPRQAGDQATREQVLAPAAQAIQRGQLVAFPTETVYGLGADAFNPEAIRKIYEVKGRPQDNPLIVHLSRLADLSRVARNIPALAYDLFLNFAPGPLSIVLPKHPQLPDIVTAGGDTVAVRFPAHPLARDLINFSGCPLVAPSANISGRPSPTTAESCYQDLQGKIPYILDGGPSEFGVESTVLDLTSETPTILRPGGLTRERLQDFCGRPVAYVGEEKADANSQAVPKSPGMKYRHYAPRAKVHILSWQDAEERKQVLANTLSQHFAPGSLASTSGRPGLKLGFFLDQAACQDLATLLADELPYMEIEDWHNLGKSSHLPGPLVLAFNYGQGALQAAHALFTSFRNFDQQGCEHIYAQAEGQDDIGLAYMERLGRAASGK